MPRDIFIADAHLLDPGDANYRRLLEFLRSERGRLRTLYILGDLFEFWVGYRHLVFAPYVPVLNALQQLREAGTSIVYVEGNHDFHLGHYIREVLGCRVLPDGGKIEIEGRVIHIAHGDLINSSDTGYLLLRRVLRSRPLRWLTAAVPGDLTWRIARWASRQSQRGRTEKEQRRLPERELEEFVHARFAEGCDVVVTGHFHQPLCREYENGLLIALGDWIGQYSYAVLEDGRFSLLRY